jgi:adenosylhomocysteine nucleosidase
MVPIGLIAAMPEECRPLLRRVAGWQACRVGRFSGYRFRLRERDCLLVRSGIGLQRAGEAARALLAEARLSLLVSFGVAGAVRDGLQIGDVVAIGSASLLDGRGRPGPFVDLARWSGPAQAAAAETLALAGGGARLVWGTALTTPGAQAVQAEALAMENPLLEMETTAIAQAAAEYNVPLMGLRGVSDNPAQPLPIDPGAVLDEDYHLRAGRLIGILARRPGIVLQLGQLRRNTTLAAENAAAAVMAALGSEESLKG